MAEIKSLSSRILNSSKVTEERSLANELQTRLGTSSFRAALAEGSADGGSNGWSTMLKAVVVKLTSERKSSDVVGSRSLLLMWHRRRSLAGDLRGDPSRVMD